MRSLLSKGPNYRESETINFNRCKESIISALNNTAEELVNKYNLTAHSLDNWKQEVIKHVNSRIDILKTKIVPQKTKQALHDEEVIQELQRLHQKFVFVSIDKASNNIGIICKRFYISRLVSEVGLSGEFSDTYKVNDTPPEEIIATNKRICEMFGLDCLIGSNVYLICIGFPKCTRNPLELGL